MRTYGLIFVVCFLSFFEARPGQCEADPVSSFAYDPVWLRLGHYQKKFLGGYKSLVDDPGFFFSPDGRDDPEKELRATLSAFSSSDPAPVGRLNQSPHCAFPARYAWLLKNSLIQAKPAHMSADRVMNGAMASGQKARHSFFRAPTPTIPLRCSAIRCCASIKEMAKRS